ncbi:hypothetical protein [Puniceicoccus vermicola]|uniref:Uncharacterized protein n=1 Tax=Puniceicoccus vermicola TaxID=388746 RepID=A0A7X1E5G9_9BACT|nr:hypothetical protein [Puniceicoccus vermicola]MBC2603156.1 hypothetical protein [Puniceicoccus vermicola]
MKSIYTAFAVFIILAAGCMTTEKVESSINLEAPFSVSIYASNGALVPANEVALKEILRFWLPKMRSIPYTFPTPSARLKIEGKTKDGIDSEMTVFVGQNWLGDGRGLVTLADTQSFKLWNIINKTGAIQSEVSTPFARASLTP